MKKEEKATQEDLYKNHKAETYTLNKLENTSTEKYITENYDRAWEDDRL